MNLRPRAAAIILNEANELLLLLQKDPKTGFEWWTLPGGGMEPEESVIDTIVREVKEECGIDCRPSKLIYMSEYVDYNIDTHHLGMFFLTEIAPDACVEVGSDPEVEVQYIQACKFVGKEAIQQAKIPIYPAVFKYQFWEDLEKNFQNYEVYQRAKIQNT